MDLLPCGPAKLPEEEKWYALRDALSHKSHPEGDWHAYAHLSSRKGSFQPLMIRRVQEVLELLETHKLGQLAVRPRCTLCENHDDYSQHLGGPKHWAALRDRLPDRVPIRILEEEFWNVWPIASGFLRFNELTGAVEMSKGARQPGCGGTVCAPRAHERPEARGVGTAYQGLPMPPWETDAWESISFTNKNSFK